MGYDSGEGPAVPESCLQPESMPRLGRGSIVNSKFRPLRLLGIQEVMS